MHLQVLVQSKYQIPPRKKNEHSSRDVKARYVVQKSLHVQ